MLLCLVSSLSPVLPVLLTVLTGSSRASLLSRLGSQSGLVLSPASPGYEERRKVMNAACTARPAVIIVPNTERDIALILEVAREEGLEVSVRSGGHSYTCTNIKEGGIHIDMRSGEIILYLILSYICVSCNYVSFVSYVHELHEGIFGCHY